MMTLHDKVVDSKLLNLHRQSPPGLRFHTIALRPLCWPLAPSPTAPPAASRPRPPLRVGGMLEVEVRVVVAVAVAARSHQQDHLQYDRLAMSELLALSMAQRNQSAREGPAE
jgi:hypothetical protein